MEITRRIIAPDAPPPDAASSRKHYPAARRVWRTRPKATTASMPGLEFRDVHNRSARCARCRA
jgi:hypothetical protein